MAIRAPDGANKNVGEKGDSNPFHCKELYDKYHLRYNSSSRKGLVACNSKQDGNSIEGGS